MQKQPINLIIEEGLLSKILQSLSINDIYNFCDSYPHLNPESFVSHQFCENHDIQGTLTKHKYIENRSWKSIASLTTPLFSENKFVPNMNSNRFGIEILTNTIKSTNKNGERRNVIIAKDPIKSRGNWITINEGAKSHVILLSPIVYYEVTILPTPQTHTVDKYIISIGFVDRKNYPEDRHVGWNDGSIAIHSDDGHLFHEKGSGESFTKAFKDGTTIGVGFVPTKNSVFFTKNGKKIGENYIKTHMTEVYPALGFSTAYSVDVNFGKQPFMFDLLGEIESFLNQE